MAESRQDNYSNLDTLHIVDLLVRGIIGIRPDEREKEQDVIINLTLYADLRKAAGSDDIADTVDYVTIKKNIIDLVKTAKFFLIEKLAAEIAKVCLRDARVQKVTVRLDKPTALRFTRSVGIEITREREA